MPTSGIATLCFFTILTVTPLDLSGQAVGGSDGARPVQGDPGISSMLVLEDPAYRVLRDYAEPGATRRMHAHSTETYQVIMLVTGKIRLTVEGRTQSIYSQVKWYHFREARATLSPILGT